MKRTKIIVLVLLALAILMAWMLDPGRYFNLAYLKTAQQSLRDLYHTYPLSTLAGYFVLYVLMAASSVPGATVMTLAGGALFGLLLGTVVVSFASSIGALLAFLVSRYLLRDWVAEKFGNRLQTIDTGMAKDGAAYLFMLRLVPAFPFFLINLLMGLTRIKARTFYWVSQIGMLAGTVVYVNAGTQLTTIESAAHILSPQIIGAFVLIGVFPLLAKKAVALLQARRVYAKWQKPSRFDRNLVVLGAGAAGLVSAYIGATVKAKVTLIEAGEMGGDCLNTGCVPSKALLHAARTQRLVTHPNFNEAMARVRHAIRTIAPHDSVERYTALGVEVIKGYARIVSPWVVEVDANCITTRITTRNIVIATGARPFIPPIPGLQGEGFHTSETIWGLHELPQRLVVLGGGPIGCELSQAFARFGSHVTLVERSPRLLMREDPDASALVTESLVSDGVAVLTNHQALRCERSNGQKHLIVSHEGVERAIAFDVLLCALGRQARTEGFGLEELGITLTPHKTIETNDYLQTIYPNILACGDVAGPYQFTHTAAHQAWYAAVNALFRNFYRFKADYAVIPWATFTDPEVARVGLNEHEAAAQGVAYEVTHYALAELDRAIIDEANRGFVKILTVPGKDRILGVTIVGERAGELIAEYVLAMKHGLGLKKVLQTIHIYPTLNEANKYAAGEWGKAHAPQRLLAWVSRYHDWMRR